MSENDPQGNDSSGFGRFVGGVYGIGAMLSMIYFEWQFAVQNGFTDWLLLGWIVPALKAAIWPYYVVVYFLGQ